MKLAGIDVSWRAKRALAGGEGGSPQEKCNSRDQKNDGCYMPNRAGESKMENSGNNFLVYAHEVPNKESTYMNFQRCLRSEIVKALRNGKLLRSAAFAFGVVALIGIEPGLLKAQDRQPRVSLPLQVGFFNGATALYITPEVGVDPKAPAAIIAAARQVAAGFNSIGIFT